MQGDARFEGLQRNALEIVNATDRIAFPSFSGSVITNFWQDAEHVRGIWRRTDLASYRTDSPNWQVTLDVDALAKAEDRNWVYRGANCLEPAERYCLVSLSDGGKDAVTIREYDAVERRFIEGGFSFPKASRARVGWTATHCSCRANGRRASSRRRAMPMW